MTSIFARTVAPLGLLALFVTVHGCRTARQEASSAARDTMLSDDLAVTARTTVEGDTAHFILTFRNEGGGPRMLEFGACPLNPVLEDGERAVFDYSRNVRPCLMYLATPTIAAGDTLAPKEFHLRLPVSEIRGDSIGAGTYAVTLLATWNDETHRIAAPPVALR